MSALRDTERHHPVDTYRGKQETQGAKTRKQNDAKAINSQRLAHDLVNCSDAGERQIRALVAYVASLGKGPPIPRPDPAKGNLSQGLHLFTEHCAGCHQVVAEGGLVTGAVPPALEDDSPVQVAQAVRIGPYVMPTFSKKAISDAQLNSIIAYVDYAKHPDDRGGWALGHVGPIPEGLVTWFIAATALVLLCVIIGKRLSSE